MPVIFVFLVFLDIILPVSALPMTVSNTTTDSSGMESNQSPIISLPFPKTDTERQQYTSELKEKGYSSQEIAEEIIKLIDSANATDLDIGEHADTKGPVISAEEMNRMAERLEITEIDPTVQSASPQYILLILTNETQPNFLSDIDNSNEDPTVKDFLKKSLTVIWKKYPTKYTTVGNKTTISFDLKNPNITLTEDENRILETINRIHFERMRANLANQKWYGEPGHGDFIYWGISQNLISEHPIYNYATTARDHAGDPDLGIPWNLPDHYYNPDYLSGFAPIRTQQGFTDAKNLLISQNYQASSIAIGCASHYLMDVGNPFHTGKESDQLVEGIYLNRTTHARYETWVASHWTTANYNFGDYAQGHYYDYLWSENPSDSTKSVAQASHPYLETLWIKFSTYSDPQLENDVTIRATTQYCIATTSQYTNGLVDNWLLTQFPKDGGGTYTGYPRDINSDRVYEDINSNGRVDYDDVVVYFNNFHWIGSNQPFRLFDYNRNGAIDFADIVVLHDMIVH